METRKKAARPGLVPSIRRGHRDASWPARTTTAGKKTKKPLLPDDYDDRFGQSAPVDQQVTPHLRGGERVELVNLTPDGLLVFDLPKLYFAFTTHFGRRSEEHRAPLTGVRIEPERSLDPQGEPLVTAFDGLLDPGLFGWKRLVELGSSALREAVVRVIGNLPRPHSLRVLVALPRDSAGL